MLYSSYGSQNHLKTIEVPSYSLTIIRDPIIYPYKYMIHNGKEHTDLRLLPEGKAILLDEDTDTDRKLVHPISQKITLGTETSGDLQEM